jgi:D-alanyl-D-alanine carboxypeptidase
MKKISLPNMRHSLYALGATALFVGVAFSGGVAFIALENSAPTQHLTAGVEFPFKPTLSPDALTARSAILFDPTDGRILFAKNADDQRPLASITKLMTATVILAT